MNWTAVSAIFAATVSFALWIANAHHAKVIREREKKEERYVTLLRSIEAFYSSGANVDARKEFIRELYLSWLYCPDEVILAGNEFIDSLLAQQSPAGEREAALGKFVLAIRRDMVHGSRVSKTVLRFDQFKLINAN